MLRFILSRKSGNFIVMIFVLCFLAIGSSQGEEEVDEPETYPKPVETESTECVGKPDGIYPNPANCSTFHACSGNVTFVIQCNEGLLFDETTSRCEWASAAKCAKLPEPSTTEDITFESSTPEIESPPVSALPVANEEESFPIEPETPPPTSMPPAPENNETEYITTTVEPQTVKPPPENMLVFKNISELNAAMDNPVEGGFNALNETLYVCRARYSPGVVMPGQTDLIDQVCYLPGEDGSFSESFDDFEVLTNPMRQPLQWKLAGNPTAKALPINTVIGGKFLASSFYSFYVGRCSVKPTEDAPERLIPGAVHFSAYSFLYESKVATQLKTFRCKESFEVLVYG